jgi:hypothetical protein
MVDALEEEEPTTTTDKPASSVAAALPAPRTIDAQVTDWLAAFCSVSGRLPVWPDSSVKVRFFGMAVNVPAETVEPFKGMLNTGETGELLVRLSVPV